MNFVIEKLIDNPLLSVRTDNIKWVIYGDLLDFIEEVIVIYNYLSNYNYR